jgi:hypothetical protein
VERRNRKTGVAARSRERSFPYLFEENAPLGEIFNRAMTGFSRQTIPAVVKAYDSRAFKPWLTSAAVTDICSPEVLNANPHLRGVLFDLPPVFAGAADLLEKENVADRIEFVRGDFFEEIPVSADVYLLKHIIHDWTDEQNVKILKNIRAAMPDAAKVLIVDAVIPEDNEPHFGKFSTSKCSSRRAASNAPKANFARFFPKPAFV